MNFHVCHCTVIEWKCKKYYFKGKVETIATNHLDNLIHNGIFIDHLPEQINW